MQRHRPRKIFREARSKGARLSRISAPTCPQSKGAHEQHRSGSKSQRQNRNQPQRTRPPRSYRLQQHPDQARHSGLPCKNPHDLHGGHPPQRLRHCPRRKISARRHSHGTRRQNLGDRRQRQRQDPMERPHRHPHRRLRQQEGSRVPPARPTPQRRQDRHVDITAPSQATLHASLDIPLRYDYPFTSTFGGASGTNGTDGVRGIDGISGTPGSMDPNNPCPGGDGSNGTNGTDGTNGGDGSDGPPVQVRVALRSGTHPLLQIGVSAPGHKDRFYLVDPQGGSLTVRSNGGDGGKGGQGGQGGRGGSGGIGTPNGRDGSSGMNGSDGRNGSPGNPGEIAITYDPQAKPYLAAIHLPNQNPKPIFNEQPVAPLW